MTDWKHLFKAEDFRATEACLAIVDDNTRQLLEDLLKSNADKANQKLWLHIQTAEKVYGDKTCCEYHDIPTNWDMHPSDSDTHQAYLLGIEKLK